MNTLCYYFRRLLPFFLVYVSYEILEIGILALGGMGDGGFSSAACLGLVNETLVSFVFCVLPYLLYLLVLPAAFHGGRKDGAVTLFLFALFSVVNAAEELVEVVSGDQFHLVTVGLLQQPREIWEMLVALPGLLPGGVVALCLVAGSVWLFRRRLLAAVPPPPAWQRLVVPFGWASLAFLLCQAPSGLVISSQAPELYRDGLVSLFGGIVAVTAVPDLGQIYAQPCVWLAVGALALYGVDAALKLYGGRTFSPLFRLQGGWQGLCARYGRFQVCLAGLLAAVLLLRLVSLGLYPLMDTTEARYGEMARKMVETGNWLQPQFDYGVPFWGKPPLSFQASALSMSLWGGSAFAARLAPFAAALAMGALFFAWPFSSHRREQGAAAFLVFMTSAAGFVASGAVMTDIFLSLGIMLSMVSFWRAIQGGAFSRRWGYFFFVGLAVGLLSKGPLAVVLCGIPIFLWTLLFRRWRDVGTRLPWWRGLLLMLALSVPWYVAAEQATPGFLRYFLWGEHVERFLVKGWQGDLYGSGHARALGTIWLYAVEMFLPWSLLAPFLWRRRGCREQGGREQRGYLWLWGLSPLLLFTLARNILPAYVLPGIPAFCLLLVQNLWQRQRRAARSWVFLPLPVVLVMALFAVGGGFSHLEYRCDREMLRAWDGVSPLYYARERVTYSGQFYSSGKARCLGDKPLDSLPQGSCLVVPEGSPLEASLADSPGWKLRAHGHKAALYGKL